ncbi:MAG: hypothetical protein HYR94_19945 [Chloroflexi bacterium]|nr:hypothetical protein [Chloroflexota bacterium]
MAVEITLKLPEELVEDARRFGQATQRDVGEVLADTLELMWSALDTVASFDLPISMFSDDEVLALANPKSEQVGTHPKLDRPCS